MYLIQVVVLHAVQALYDGPILQHGDHSYLLSPWGNTINNDGQFFFSYFLSSSCWHLFENSKDRDQHSAVVSDCR